MAAVKLFPLLMVLSCACLMVSSFPALHSMQRRGGQKLCGRMLSQALALVCGSMYYEPNGGDEKRSFYNSYWDINPMSLFGKPRIHDPEAKTPTALLFETDSFERETRGIIDECCRNSCSYSVLASYCSK